MTENLAIYSHLGYRQIDRRSEDGYHRIFMEKTLKGTLYGSADVRVDFHRMLRLWKAGRLDLEGMISKRIKLTDVNQAFDDMKAGLVIRSVIEL